MPPLAPISEITLPRDFDRNLSLCFDCTRVMASTTRSDCKGLNKYSEHPARIAEMIASGCEFEDIANTNTSGHSDAIRSVARIASSKFMS